MTLRLVCVINYSIKILPFPCELDCQTADLLSSIHKLQISTTPRLWISYSCADSRCHGISYRPSLPLGEISTRSVERSYQMTISVFPFCGTLRRLVPCLFVSCCISYHKLPIASSSAATIIPHMTHGHNHLFGSFLYIILRDDLNVAFLLADNALNVPRLLLHE
jgi:hypothetical protein